MRHRPTVRQFGVRRRPLRSLLGGAFTWGLQLRGVNLQLKQITENEIAKNANALPAGWGLDPGILLGNIFVHFGLLVGVRTIG